jgi:uncharacterized protein YbaR (Trm112 family)
MDGNFLHYLRCPLDPTHQATLAHSDHQLICSGCNVAFPIRQGLPILVAEEAQLPPGYNDLNQLPCRRRAARHVSTQLK